jgi:hypothetical protein
VLGKSNGNDAIHGESHTVNGSGVAGIAFNGGPGVGVYGENYGSTGGSHGMMGVTHTSNGNGVYGTNDATAGVGVFGENDTSGGFGVYGRANNGFGMATDSNAWQARTMGGWVKAMAVIDETIAPVGPNQIVRCYNSQISGAAASTPPCGFNMTYGNLGDHVIDFGFQVSDRFVQATPVYTGNDSNLGGVVLNIFLSSDEPNRVELSTFYNGSGDFTDTTVYLMVF